MSELTAARVPCTVTGRTLYRLSEPTHSDAYPSQFEYVVLSLGRDGDTAVFPATDTGQILDYVGFGLAIGPLRRLVDSEFDDYVIKCIEQHERDGGAGLTNHPDANIDERTRVRY